MQLDTIHNTDALSGLKLLPDVSVDCIVTSPPYWQMRDYGIGGIEWPDGWVGQLGLEPTRDDFIAHLCMIFDECRRVLKPTGTLWVNLGDTFNNPGKYSNKPSVQTIGKGNDRDFVTGRRGAGPNNTLPSKSLCNIPGKFADEMILRGWILRNEIIWHKPACMPSSVRDRFTCDFEKIFFFTKSARYLFNRQFEEYAPSTGPRYNRPVTLNGKGKEYREISGKPQGKMTLDPRGRNMRCVWRVSYEPSREAHFAMYPSRLVETPVRAGSPDGGVVLDPFMGGGTTAVVTRRLGRRFVGFEPNAEYIAIAEKRLRNCVVERGLFE